MTTEAEKEMWLTPTSEMNPAWIRANCKGIVECTRCTASDISNSSAPRSCFRLLVQPGGERLVLKQLASDDDGKPTEQRIALSKALGLAREALFYSLLAPALGDIVPRVYYSQGDMASGVKHTIMEDLFEYVDSGVLFGPGNPNNWKRDLPAMCARAGSPVPSAAHVASVSFKAFAQLHAAYWRDARLLVDNKQWLRGAEWTVGQGRESWEAAQAWARDRFVASRGKREQPWQWDALVLAAVEAAVANISWERQLARLNSESDWTLVQGDCWPGNVLWRGGADSDAGGARVKLVDFEMVGVGSGAQDLGQYMISNVEPGVRRACEAQLLRDYHAELMRLGVRATYTFEHCWREYVMGGLERWLWFLCYYVELPAHGVFFHAQIAAWMHDHNVVVADIGQIRP